MIVVGSTACTISGRKKKTTRQRKQIHLGLDTNWQRGPVRRETRTYPSADSTGCSTTVATKKPEHKFTVAPAYNKGAYQVISKENIKDIGK